jgi:DNA-binding XRE family transcriptional regulator
MFGSRGRGVASTCSLSYVGSGKTARREYRQTVSSARATTAFVRRQVEGAKYGSSLEPAVPIAAVFNRPLDEVFQYENGINPRASEPDSLLGAISKSEDVILIRNIPFQVLSREVSPAGQRRGGRSVDARNRGDSRCQLTRSRPR